MSRARPYVGVIGNERHLLRATVRPTPETHGARFGAIIGPFRTVRAARYMAAFGSGNPHLRTVANAERIAATPEGRAELARYLPTLYGYNGGPYTIGDRVELHPGTDLWARGARFGTVRSVSATRDDRVHVELDKLPGRLFSGAATTFKRTE